MYSRNVGGGAASPIWITIGVNICLAPGASTGCQGRTGAYSQGHVRGGFPAWVGGGGTRVTPESLGAGSEATLPVQGWRQGPWLFDPDQQLFGPSVKEIGTAASPAQ